MQTEVAIVGGGPGGTTTALFLAQKGIQSVIIEKDEFPRFHIGESLTGECGRLVRELGLETEMVKYQFPVKYGVKVFGPAGKNTFWIPVMSQRENGELLESSTWQVERSHFDETLLQKAKAMGVQFVTGQAVKPLRDESGKVAGVQVRLANGTLSDIQAQLVVDASGQATFLASAGVIGPKERGKYDRQVAIFTHVRGAVRDPEKDNGNTLIFYQQRNFWAWLIPISPEVTSVGIVTPSEYYRAQPGDKREFFLREMHQIHPNLAERMQDVELAQDVRAASNYSYHVKEFAGDGFLCVGDSHRFVDPIFSFGLYFAMAEAEKAAAAVACYLTEGDTAVFDQYQREAERGQDVIQDLLDAFWEFPRMFAYCAHYRYEDDFINMFAGRIYTEKPYPGLSAMRKALADGRGKLALTDMEAAA